MKVRPTVNYLDILRPAGQWADISLKIEFLQLLILFAQMDNSRVCGNLSKYWKCGQVCHEATPFVCVCLRVNAEPIIPEREKRGK